MSGPPRILIVDANPAARRVAAAVALSLGLETTEAGTGQSALTCFAERPPNLLLLDPQLPDMAGYALLSQWTAAAPNLQAAITTAEGSLDCVVQAMRLGACDYLPKPFAPDQLRLMLQRMQQRLSSRPVAPHWNLASSAVPFDHLTRLSEIERVTIERVFHQVNGDKMMAGKLLGISRATLYRKLKRYQISISPRPGEAHL
jgi:DNA-binding NtrC family response regulator